MAPVASKFDTLPFNCYELCHTWNPSCTRASLEFGGAIFKEALKVYTTCYVISLIASRKIPKSSKDVTKLAQDIVRSSLFLGNHGILFALFLCFIRKLKGNFNYFTIGLIPSLLACYISIFIEKPQRRPLLALYVTNVATETVYRMLRSRGIVRDIAHFEFFLFCFSMVTVVYQMKKGIDRAGVVNAVLKKIFGPEEFQKRSGVEPSVVYQQRQSSPAAEQGPRRMSLGGPGLRVVGEENENGAEPEAEPEAGERSRRRLREDTFRNRFIHFVLWMHQSVTDIASHLERMVGAIYEGQIHEMCPHSQSCFDYWMEGFYSRFMAGFGIHAIYQAAVFSKNLLAPRKARMDKTGSLLSNSLLFPCIKSGMGLGMMNLAFRLINCSFRWLKSMDGPGHCSFAAFIASALGFCILKPPNSLGLYLFFKSAETAITESHKNNNWRFLNWIDRAYGGGWCLLYSISTAILFNVALFEPQNLKPSYYHFLARTSGGRMYDFNRVPLDVYGCNSSLLMKDFWPKLKEELLSEHMKQLIKMRDATNQNRDSMHGVMQQFINAN